MTPVPPLLTVTLAFRSKTDFQGQSDILSLVSLFLDSSERLTLAQASKFNSVALLDRIWANNEKLTNPNHETPKWTIQKFLRTDQHYRQYQFVLAMEVAMRNGNLEMIQWLFEKFPGCIIRACVVNEAATVGSTETLNYFMENGTEITEDEDIEDLEHPVEWTESFVFAAKAGRSDLMKWLYRSTQHGGQDIAIAFEVALINGDVASAEWIESQEEVMFPVTMRQRLAHYLVQEGRLDLLQWLQERGLLGGVVGLLVKTAGMGSLDMSRWLAQHEHAVFLHFWGPTGSKSEVYLSIHAAAVNGHLNSVRFLREQTPSEECEQHQVIELAGRLYGWMERDDLDAMIERAAAIPYGWIFSFHASQPAHPMLNVVSPQTMTEAAMNRHFVVAKWLYDENQGEIDLFYYCNGDTVAVDAAAKFGHLDAVALPYTVHQASRGFSEKHHESQSLQLDPGRVSEDEDDYE